jgi:hypothetical protein
MIVRLGDAATDAASAEDAGFISSLTSQTSTPLPSEPGLSTADLAAWGAYAGVQQTNLTAGTISNPSGAMSINSAGNVVPTASSTSVGSSLSSLFSNLLGGSSTKVAPAGYSYNSAGQLVANTSSNSTLMLYLFGAIGIVVLVSVLPGKKR